MKVWTALAITFHHPVLLFGLQRKSPRWEIVRILQRENKTFLTVIRDPAVALVPALPIPHPRFPLHRRKAGEDVPFHV
jgi:hypothetical protein